MTTAWLVPGRSESPAPLMSQIWSRLGAATRSQDDPWRTPALATVDESGRPKVRTVVLRRADFGLGILEFHTDIRSPKVREIRRKPLVEWHFYDGFDKVQLRGSGGAMVHTDDAIQAGAWKEVPAVNRSNYESKLAPGEDFGSEPETISGGQRDGQWFAAVRVAIERWDWLLLSSAGHRRAIWDRVACPDWKWVAA